MLVNRIKLARSRREKTEGGFTLIELLVVVVILGILIAIAIPTYLNYRQGANDKSAQSDVRNAVVALESCAVEGSYPANGDFTGGAFTCAGGQKFKANSNTTITYFTGGTSGSAYIISGKATTGGSNAIYCFSSAAGGSVTTTTTAVTVYRGTC